MAERTTITQRVQVGPEVTPGTAVAATKRLQSADISLSPDGGISVFRGAGAKFPAIASIGKEFAGGSLDGTPTYTELVYFLSMLLGPATIVQVGADNAWDWTWDIETYDVQDPKTFTVERGSSVQAEQAAGMALTALGIEYSRDELTLSGDAIAQAFTTGFTLTAAPPVVDLDLVPVLPKQVDIFLDDTAAGLGTTKLLRVLAASWELGDRFGALWPLNSALPSYAALYEIEPSADVSLTMEADATGMGLFSEMRAGDTRFLRIGSSGGVIDGTSNYEMEVDLAVKIDDIPDFSDEDGIYAIGWEMGLFHDPTWGKAGSIRIRTSLETL